MLFLYGIPATAQMVGTDIFLQANHLEVGISTNGSFGSNGNAPAGYHPRPDNGVTPPAPLGFVSDPDQDGWAISLPGSPAFLGDFFLPGDPQEGWELSFGGTRSLAYRMTPGFTGTLRGDNTAYSGTATVATGTWRGTMGPLAITQTTTLKKDKMYFVVNVKLHNTGATNLNNIYYCRTLDAEPDAAVNGLSYDSDKNIQYQTSAGSKKCLVYANGTNISKAFVGLGTKDCRAKCFIGNQFTPKDASHPDIYNQAGTASAYLYHTGAKRVDGSCMGIIYKIDTIKAGKETELNFAYVLKKQDLDSALEETSPRLMSDSGIYQPHTTFRLCPGNNIPLKIFGGSAYQWTWTPAIDLDAPLILPPDSQYIQGAAIGDSVMATVRGPRTYIATGVSNCDTVVLTFYVDTIAFTVPPSVVTPVNYCQNDNPSALSASGAAGTTLLWSTEAGGPESALVPTPSTATTGTATYYVRQRSREGCYSPHDSIKVTVRLQPEPPLLRDTTYCYGAVAAAVNASGNNIRWYDAAADGNRFATAPTPSTTGSGVQYYASQELDGCESKRDTLNINVSRISAAFTTAKDSFCFTEPFIANNSSRNELNGTAAPFSSLWTFGEDSASSQRDLEHHYTEPGLYTIHLNVSSEYGCTDSTEKTVRIFPDGSISGESNRDSVCPGQAIVFSLRPSPYYEYIHWNFSDGHTLRDNRERASYAFAGPGSYTVTAQVYYTACGEKNITFPVLVYSQPKVNLGPDTSICLNGTPLVLVNKASGEPGHHYQWNTGDTSRSITVAHHGDYWLRVSEQGCDAADSITVNKDCYINIPNAFAPGDSDPANAYFLPRNLLSHSLARFHMQIFNRWGILLFETDNVDGKGWDGRYNGSEQPLGVYVYRIKAVFNDGTVENYEGNVTLVR